MRMALDSNLKMAIKAKLRAGELTSEAIEAARTNLHDYFNHLGTI